MGLHRCVGEPANGAHAGIVDPHADRNEPFCRYLGEPLYRLEIRNIRRNGNRLPTERFAFPSKSCECSFAPGGEGDASTSACKGLHHCRADPAGCTSDDDSGVA